MQDYKKNLFPLLPKTKEKKQIYCIAYFKCLAVANINIRLYSKGVECVKEGQQPLLLIFIFRSCNKQENYNYHKNEKYGHDYRCSTTTYSTIFECVFTRIERIKTYSPVARLPEDSTGILVYFNKRIRRKSRNIAIDFKALICC